MLAAMVALASFPFLRSTRFNKCLRLLIKKFLSSENYEITVVGQCSADGAGGPAQSVDVFEGELAVVHLIVYKYDALETAFEDVFHAFPVVLSQVYHQLFHYLEQTVVFGVLDHYAHRVAIIVSRNQHLLYNGIVIYQLFSAIYTLDIKFLKYGQFLK